MADLKIISQAADDRLLHLHHWPAASPKAVLSIIHGFGEHGGRYAHMAAYLNTHNITVLAVDLRGHGLTEGPRGICKNYDSLIGDTEALLKHSKTLYPDCPQFLFGHSMGGGIVLAHGLKHLEAGLAGYLLSAPFIQGVEPVPTPLRLAAKIMRKLAPKAALSLPIETSKISTLPEEQESYLSDLLNHGRLGYGLALGMVENGENVLANAARWPHRLRLWYTPKDQLVNFAAIENFAQHLPMCEATVFDRSEHEMHNDVSREKVYRLMRDFILQDLTTT